MERLKRVAGEDGASVKKAGRVAFYIATRAAARVRILGLAGQRLERIAPGPWSWLRRRSDAYLASALRAAPSPRRRRCEPCGGGLAGPQDWTNSLHAGDAGLKDGQSIRTRDSAIGMVAWGLHKPLTEGRYKLVFSLSGATPLSSAKPGDIVGVVTFLSWRMFVAWKAITWADMERGELEVEINAADDVSVQDMFRLEALVYNWYPVDLRIDKVTCELIGPPQDAPSLTECRALMLDNWLPMLALGPNGRRQGLSVVSERSLQGFGNVVYGPYWYLPAGAYSAVFDIECNSHSDDALIGRVDAVQSLNVLKEFDFSAAALKAGGITLPFSVGEMPADSHQAFFEIRVLVDRGDELYGAINTRSSSASGRRRPSLTDEGA